MDASPTLDDALGVYLGHLRVERGLAVPTLSAYRRDLGRYLAHLRGRGHASLATVAEQDVSAFTAVLRSGADGGSALSAASAARAVVAVRGLHRFAADEGWADDDVASAVRPPPTRRSLPRALSLAQVETLLEASSSGGAGSADDVVAGAVGLRDRALLELLYGTGARISELVGLDVDDVAETVGTVGAAGPSDDAGAAPLLLLRGKGDRQRLVPVGRYAAGAVAAYVVRGRPVLVRAASRSGAGAALLVGQRGARLSRQGAWAVVAGAAQRAGLSSAVGPHTLRHSYATHLVERGADVRLVQELLGHASVTTTQIYTAVTVDTLREAYAGAHPRALG